MDFRIADTFTDSLARLTGDEQKAVKTTAFDLQMNPAAPGLQFHKLDKARDKNFWSVRVSRDIRLIIHKTAASLLLCYVDHHDKAYQWAERRKLETHPTTGAAQLVEIRETVKEITVPKYVEVEQPAPAKKAAETPASYGRAKTLLFAETPEDDLLAYGVPREWLGDVRKATEDSLFAVAEHLPHEAAEALLDLATGGRPQVRQSIASAKADPFAHPDAQRRFRVMANSEELQRALEFPWEKWTVFLHPAQRNLVERDYGGPARISGSAGTGKTIVALHRAVHLARQHPHARVLLTTFSETLASALRTRLRRLIGSEPKLGERLEVHAIGSIGRRLYETAFDKPQIATPEQIREALGRSAKMVPEQKFSRHFLWTEWTDIVDAWQVKRWDEYKGVQRLGRKTRLGEKQRTALWAIFEAARADLVNAGLITPAELCSRVAEKLKEYKHPPFDFAVVDEAQDLGVAELRFLAALGGSRPNGLFFAGDLGQRIFQTPFSWKSLGVDVRGRSQTLKINYRTTHQIRRHADRLLPESLADVDGNVEGRKGTISVFEGIPPVVRVFDDEKAETAGVSEWLAERLKEGLKPHEIGVFVRAKPQIARALAAVKRAKLAAVELGVDVETRVDHVAVSSMHLAKGLEFRAVVVMACDDEVIPLQERIESVSDESDLEEVYSTERHLLYVACTRARDHLLVSGVEPASEFLDDLATSHEQFHMGKGK
ncbi:MAG: DEAD/DEAH box helicase [Planctomycetes bacterium]|nr:DEAD/DEAH box helicase [Planctomycetota bacterium]